MASAEPRILVALGDRWSCVLACAELRERRCAPVCVERLAVALVLPDEDALEPVRVVLVDREALRAVDIAALQWLRATGSGPAVVLVTTAGVAPPAGPWDRILVRPLTMGAVADAVERFATDAARIPDAIPRVGVELRLGPPWPWARCTPCRKSRHGEGARDAREHELVRVALVQFALEHAPHASRAAVGTELASSGAPHVPEGS